MSKEAAMEMMTGVPATTTNPSLITGSMATETPPSTVSTPATLDSDRFAKLAAREARLVKERETFKSEAQKVQEDKAKIEEVRRQVETFEHLKKTDPIKAFESLGFTQSDFVNWVADKNTEPTPAQLAQNAAQEEIKKYQQEVSKREEETKAKKDAENIASYSKALGEKVKTESDKYKFISYYEEAGVDQLIENIGVYIKDNPELSLVEIEKMAKDDLEEFYKDRYEDMGKKIAPKVEAAAVPAKDEPLKPQVSPRSTQRTRTLSDKTVLPAQKRIPSLPSQATATASSVSTKRETPSEKRARLENWLRTGVKS